MTTYSAILESEAHANGQPKDGKRYLNTIADIRYSQIEGHDVIDVITTDHGAEECRVKHFRYNYLCKDGCNHTPASYGILRYFGITLVIDGDIDIGGIYKPNYYSELHICGKSLPYDGVRQDMHEAKKELPVETVEVETGA